MDVSSESCTGDISSKLASQLRHTLGAIFTWAVNTSGARTDKTHQSSAGIADVMRLLPGCMYYCEGPEYLGPTVEPKIYIFTYYYY